MGTNFTSEMAYHENVLNLVHFQRPYVFSKSVVSDYVTK
jgi:hypothetical protein